MRLYGFHSDTRVADAESLPFEDNFFDFVYSFGVVHHCPSTEKAVSEIYRVLKPEGSCYLAVYNRNSMYFWWTIFLCKYIIKGGFLKRTLQQQLSLIEYPNNDTGLVVRLYTKKEFVSLMSEVGFTITDVKIEHLPRGSIIGNWMFSDRWIQKKRNSLGWYIVVTAEKRDE